MNNKRACMCVCVCVCVCVKYIMNMYFKVNLVKVSVYKHIIIICLQFGFRVASFILWNMWQIDQERFDERCKTGFHRLGT